MQESEDIFFKRDAFLQALLVARESCGGSNSKELIPEPSAEQIGRIIKLINNRHHSICYPGFSCKALNIWYEITKQHFLENGNKRVGFACFVCYCFLNGKGVRFSKGDPAEYCKKIAASKPNEDPKDNIISFLKSEISFYPLS